MLLSSNSFSFYPNFVLVIGDFSIVISNFCKVLYCTVSYCFICSPNPTYCIACMELWTGCFAIERKDSE